VKRVVAKRTLKELWETHAASEQYLKTWYDTVLKADWKTPHDVKQAYANASILKNNRIVFNIKGNDFRLVAKFNFKLQWVFIRFVGTHEEYDKIDAENI
jgi:mRNA interferase HigB